jgi:hypothetical protein
MPAGVAGHNPEVFHWAERNLEVDFYMCCYYNPASRVDSPESSSGGSEWFNDRDRDIMVEAIAGLSKPAIHYKVMAAGRKTPEEGLGFAAEHMRSGDAVCVGVYDEDKPGMLREDVGVFNLCLSRGTLSPYLQSDFVPSAVIHAILVAPIGRPGSCLSLQVRPALPDGGSVSSAACRLAMYTHWQS